MSQEVEGLDMRAYRVDRRLFKAGDIVTQTGEYLTKLDSERIRVEKYLECARPDAKPRRGQVLFLFEFRPAAERFWTKEQNGKLYEVEIQGAPFHCGDMGLTDEIFQVRADAAHAREIADRYWREDKGSCPQIELLVKEALVVEVIFTTETERRRALAARAGIQLP